MRKLIAGLSVVFMVGLFASCNKFLDEMPDNRTQIDNLEKVKALLVTAYPARCYATWLEPRCDGMADHGATLDGTQPIASFAFIYTAYRWDEYPSMENDDDAEAYWTACYGAIAAANHALEALDELGHPKGSEPYRAEALLCRAYAHFCLLTLFTDFFDEANRGTNPGIPYVTEPEDVINKQYDRETVAATLAKVKDDLAEGLKGVGTASDFVQPKFHFTLDAARMLALRIARPLGIPAFICDPVTVDEMTDEARISGHPMLPRMMTGHALNCRAMALRCAADVLHKPLADCRLIVLHLGGGGSARLFIGGKMVDGVRDDEWMFAPERMGGVSLQPLVAMCYSGAYTKQNIMDLIRGKGGLMAHLGTANAQEVEQPIADGDAHAKLVYDGMLYSCARAIGGLAAAADGRVDRIILTGGLAHSHYVTGYLTQKLSFIAPVEVMAGEFELEALAAGASRVLNGQEQPRRFADIPQA